jgi:predicted NBD/HSP70 family sugar kinase
VNLGIGEEPYPLGAEIEAAIGMPVAIENDVKAAALGLHDDLAHQGEATSSLALLNIGTGIAAGVVVDGSIFRGANGMAGEIGHVIIDEGGIDCRCGQRGCLETVAAGPAISREWAGGAESLFSAATNGDRRAQHVAQSVGGYLARAITWLAATFDIDQVYLGGGVTRAGKPFLDAVRQKLMDYAENSRLAAQRLDPERVLLAPGNGFLGPRGAAVLADRALRSLAWKE